MTPHFGPRFRTHIGKDWAGNDRLYILQDQWGTRDLSGQGIVVKTAVDFVWEDRCEGAMFEHQDGIAFANDLIQSIMDKAWEAGYRPRQHTATQNEVSAIKGHLEDMRAIAFKRLKIKGPECS